jgi:hypothetical protein
VAQQSIFEAEVGFAASEVDPCTDWDGPGERFRPGFEVQANALKQGTCLILKG